MPTAVTIVVRGFEAAKEPDRRRALKAGLREMGALHHRELKDKKFRNSAMSRYNLRPRSRRYNQRKLDKGSNDDGKKAKGAIKPFVWTGVTRQLVNSSEKVELRDVSEGRGFAHVILYAPVLNYQPWLRDEFERTRQDETEMLSAAGLKKYVEVLRAVRPRRKRIAKS